MSAGAGEPKNRCKRQRFTHRAPFGLPKVALEH
jgi:hypothetical protein